MTPSPPSPQNERMTKMTNTTNMTNTKNFKSIAISSSFWMSRRSRKKFFSFILKLFLHCELVSLAVASSFLSARLLQSRTPLPSHRAPPLFLLCFILNWLISPYTALATIFNSSFGTACWSASRAPPDKNFKINLKKLSRLMKRRKSGFSVAIDLKFVVRRKRWYNKNDENDKIRQYTRLDLWDFGR